MERNYKYTLVITDEENDEQVGTLSAYSLDSLEEDFRKIETSIRTYETKLMEEAEAKKKKK